MNMQTALREVVLDTETTGLDNDDRVIEIACVELINYMPTGRTFHVHINPDGRKVHPGALKIHGLTNEFLKRKRKFKQHVDKFLAFIGDATLVIHNAEFDLRMLNNELARIGRPPLSNPVVDTLPLAREKKPGGTHNLDALCRAFHIDLSKRKRHEALLDCQLLAQVYLELRGGKQFGLDVAVEQKKAVAFVKPDYGPRRFISRLTPEEAAAHRAFVASLGKGALWQAYLTPPEQTIEPDRLDSAVLELEPVFRYGRE